MRIGIWGLISRALHLGLQTSYSLETCWTLPFSVVPDLCSVLKGDHSHACAVGLWDRSLV